MTTTKRYGFVIDVSRCIDCRACLVACSVENQVPMNHTRIWVHDLGLQGTYPSLEQTFVPYNCMHCENPPCTEVCVSGATYKEASTGLVLVDQEACIGCGACVAACKNASASLFVGAKVSQLALLPQGHPERASRVTSMVQTMDGLGFGNCSNEAECEAVCPKEISIANIARMRREYMRALLTGTGR